MNFENIKVLVIGDLMLDIYKYGTASRISPEAPVPVVLVSNETVSAGGAANVAMNMRRLGCQVELVGYIGSDHAGLMLEGELERYGISYNYSVKSNAVTTSKTRIVSDGQHMIRYDDDSDIHTLSYRPACEPILIHHLVELRQKQSFDVVVVSDYAKGTITKEVMDIIKESFECPIICDIKPANKHLFADVFCVMPNSIEAREMAPGTSNLKRTAKAIKDDLGLRVVVITLSQYGLFLLDENNDSHLFKAHVSIDQNDTSNRLDVTGAGDTVLSTFASCIANGYTTKESAHLGNLAAGVVVRKPGTTVCSLEELRNAYLRL